MNPAASLTPEAYAAIQTLAEDMQRAARALGGVLPMVNAAAGICAAAIEEVEGIPAAEIPAVMERITRAAIGAGRAMQAQRGQS